MKLIQKDEYMGGEFVSDVFRQTSIGAIVAGMVNNDDEVLTNCDCEVQTINGMIGSTLELVADAVENGDKVDEHRAGNVADRLRLMASLSRFCSEAMTMIQDAQYRATVSATEAAKKSAQDASQKMGGGYDVD